VTIKYLRPTPRGLIPRGDGDGEKVSPVALDGEGDGEFFPHGDGDGEALPDGEFPVDIWNWDQL